MLVALLGALTLGTVPAADPTISGTVRYPDGRVAANCRVVVLHPAFEPMQEVRCDASGRYKLQLAAGTYNAIAILDDGYGKTTLEFWAWNVRVAGDLVLDATIGQLEVYNLSVWNSKGGGPSFFLSLRPMSLERALANPAVAARVVGNDTLNVLDISPALARETIRVSLDDAPVEVETLQWYYERSFDKKAGTYRDMPVALLQLRRPVLTKGLRVVRVRITDAKRGTIGEGITFFESNEAGLEF